MSGGDSRTIADCLAVSPGTGAFSLMAIVKRDSRGVGLGASVPSFGIPNGASLVRVSSQSCPNLPAKFAFIELGRTTPEYCVSPGIVDSLEWFFEPVLYFYATRKPKQAVV